MLVLIFYLCINWLLKYSSLALEQGIRHWKAIKVNGKTIDEIEKWLVITNSYINVGRGLSN